jgi:hypothetical protein
MLIDQKLKRALQQGHVTLTLPEEGEDEGSCYDYGDYDWQSLIDPEPEYPDEGSCYDPHYESYYDWVHEADLNYDPAHEADMRQLRKEQLAADISPEEAEEECRENGLWLRLEWGDD